RRPCGVRAAVPRVLRTPANAGQRQAQACPSPRWSGTLSQDRSRALVLERFGALPRLVERPMPQRSPGETLVRGRAAAAGHLDLNVVDGRFGILPELPSVPGTESCGTVVASDTHPVGSLVRLRGAGLGLRRDGGWAEHAVVPDKAVVPTPPGTDPAVA